MKRIGMAGLALGLLLPILGLGAGCTTLQATGERKFMLLSWDQEIQLGRESAPDFEKEFGERYGDLAVQAYVRSVGERVSRATTLPDLPYQFAVLSSDVVNAFALPGGPVYVTRGLLEKLTTEGQLAAVLGHEMAHVNARHGAQQISRELGVQVLLEVIGAAAGRTESAGKWQQAENLAKVVGSLVGLKYSRDMESQADRLGLDYMVASGYAPAEMVRLLDVFVSMSEGGRPSEWLSTHPNPDNRVQSVQTIIQEKYAGRAGRVADVEYKREILDRLSKSGS